MRKIIGILRPFDIKQQFFVYEDGNKIDNAETIVDDIPKEILKLANEYDITQIDLTGPKQYAKGIRKKIQEQEITTYSENKLEINLI